MEIFKKLDEVEIPKFKEWARNNYKPGTAIDPLWHPVVKEECEKLNKEFTS